MTAVVPVLFGGAPLDNGHWTVDLPLLGEISFTSALAFDTGVYLVVVGLVFMVFEAFGGEDSDLQGFRDDPASGADPDGPAADGPADADGAATADPVPLATQGTTP